MRNRNNRIAVRVTNKEFDRINEMASKSIFPKEKLIRLIVTGYPIQEKPSDDCKQFELTSSILCVPTTKVTGALVNRRITSELTLWSKL